MTNDGKHDASPSFNVPISTLFWEDDLCVAFRVKSDRPFEFQKRNQNFICAYKETRSIAMRVNNPDRSPVGIHGMSLIPSAPLKLARLPACSLLPSSLTFYVADPVSSIPDYSQVYGTRKNFPVYGSFTTDPDAKPVTSTYFPSSGV
jgi:hypothetical protein